MLLASENVFHLGKLFLGTMPALCVRVFVCLLQLLGTSLAACRHAMVRMRIADEILVGGAYN